MTSLGFIQLSFHAPAVWPGRPLVLWREQRQSTCPTEERRENQSNTFVSSDLLTIPTHRRNAWIPTEANPAQSCPTFLSVDFGRSTTLRDVCIRRLADS